MRAHFLFAGGCSLLLWCGTAQGQDWMRLDPGATDLGTNFAAALGPDRQDPAPAHSHRRVSAAPHDLTVSFGEVSSDWTFLVAFYLWVPAIEGGTRIGGVAAPVDMDIGDVLDQLQGALTGHFRAQTGKWAIIADGMWVKLGDDLGGGISFEIQQVIVETAVAYEIGNWPLGQEPMPAVRLEGLLGTRYNYLQSGVVSPGMSLETNIDWVDLVVGGNLWLDLTDELAIWIRGDVGGFGIGSSSDLVWNLVVALDWTFADRFSLVAGYRVLDYDYDRGSGPSTFIYNVTMQGPLLALTFTF